MSMSGPDSDSGLDLEEVLELSYSNIRLNELFTVGTSVSRPGALTLKMSEQVQFLLGMFFHFIGNKASYPEGEGAVDALLQSLSVDGRRLETLADLVGFLKVEIGKKGGADANYLISNQVPGLANDITTRILKKRREKEGLDV